MRADEQPAARCHELVDRVADGRATEAEHAEMQELLRGDAAARRYYIETMELHAGLRKSRLPMAVQSMQATDGRPARSRELSYALFLAGAVVAASLLLA